MSQAKANGGIARHLVVDAANVVGSRPDGWWRDRAGATRRLIEQIQQWAAREAGWQVIVVVEGKARAVADEVSAGRAVRVVAAAGSGDDTIVETVAALTAPVTVVTSDRGLRRRLDVPAVGARWLTDRLTADPEPAPDRK